MTTRRPKRIAALLACAAAALLTASCSKERGEPNVLLICIDTLRADRMSLHGHERPTTPGIERFAATATTFDRAYSPSSWTRASFASYFTGLIPSAHGCEDREGVLDPALTTLAERFRARGFATAGFFANHNIGPDFGFDQGFDIYEHPELNAGYPDDHQVSDAASVNERVLRWLHDERPADRPWFLFVLYMDPHDPYLPHEEHRFGEPAPDGVDGSRRFLDSFGRSIGDAEQLRDIHRAVRDLYDGEIAFVDAHVAALLRELERAGLDDDTVVILTADHGEGLWEHEDYRGHGRQVYEEQIHVPLIVRWPGVTEPGRRIAPPVSTIDLFGALAAGFDLADTTEHQAGSLLDALEPGWTPRPILVEERLEDVALRARIEWPWKLIRDDVRKQNFLYNLETNPDESRRKREIKPRLTRRMAADMNAATAAGRAWYEEIALEGIDQELSEEAKKELRALGYVR